MTAKEELIEKILSYDKELVKNEEYKRLLYAPIQR